MTDASPALRVTDLQVVYQRGGQPAVHDLSFSMNAGEGLLIAGDEGAGKSTVLRAVLGLCLFSGEVLIHGEAPGTSAALTRRTGYAPQGRRFLEGHSPQTMVRLVAALRTGGPAADAAEAALDRAGLAAERRGSRNPDVEEYRRAALACALAGDPDILVLDDPWEFDETIDAVRRTRDRGGLVIAASHDPGGLPALLGRTITLVNGVAT